MILNEKERKKSIKILKKQYKKFFSEYRKEFVEFLEFNLLDQNYDYFKMLKLDILNRQAIILELMKKPYNITLNCDLINEK